MDDQDSANSVEIELAEERASSIALAAGVREHPMWRKLMYQTINKNRLSGDEANERILNPVPPRRTIYPVRHHAAL